MDTRAHFLRVIVACAAAAWGGSALSAQAGPPGDEMIVSLRANAVQRGELTVVRTPDGDYWLPASALEALKVQPLAAARRDWQGETYFSSRALGATGVVFDQGQLALSMDFPAARLEPTHVDLSNRAAPIELKRPQNSAILNYRAAVRRTGDSAPVQLRMTTELNLRVGEVLLRQEAKYETGRDVPSFARGFTQLIWDDRLAGRRVVAGDQLTAGGPFGTTIPGAGVSLSRLYAITPDVLKQPTASIQVSAATPSQVEVAVDGSTIYRTTVAPGPVSLDNLFYYGGARTVRVTVTDANGRRQVIDQPFLFTDNVLAKGLHEYSYFAGRRSELGPDDRWHYREQAWQAYHRYGVNDQATVEAGGEGTSDFASGGAGITLRSDKLGLLSVGALASTDRKADRDAQGWSLRYTYIAPQATLFAGRRVLGAGFRTFGAAGTGPWLLDETRVGASARLSTFGNISLDYTRTHDTLETRSNYAVRMANYLSRRTSIQAEYVTSRAAGQRDWAFNVYLRFDLDQQRWAATTYRNAANSRGIDIETGKQLDQGEGVGYRVGTNVDRTGDREAAFAYGQATWNLRPVALEVYANNQVRGGSARYLEAAVSGAVVGLDGYVGATRQVSDGFALARLGVPQGGIDIFLNSQVQGKTDKNGDLLIPNVGAFGRQDISLEDKQLSMEYNLARKRITIAPAYKSGTLVEFGGRKLRALSGMAWRVEGGIRKAVASQTWSLSGPAGLVQIETAPSGDFYLDDAPAGSYRGKLQLDGRAYTCRMDVPEFPEAVYELTEGLTCVE